MGGSSSYLEPLTAAFKDRIRLKSPVAKVERKGAKVKIVAAGEEQLFDEVIFACHGKEALSLLASPTDDEKSVLHEFQSSSNDVVLHTDTAFLPKRRLGWASWNYNMTDTARSQTTLTYNMNILQKLSKSHTYLVTLNQDIENRYILGNYHYSHPVFSLEAIGAQQKWEIISGQNNTHYCGAYWFNGFHEDGVNSALRVCTAIEESP
ncbi:MAG: FAD-dependent oxidoreductase, partial [Desulforhopalus sp.]